MFHYGFSRMTCLHRGPERNSSLRQFDRNSRADRISRLDQRLARALKGSAKPRLIINGRGSMTTLDLHVTELMADNKSLTSPDDCQPRATREVRHEYPRNPRSILQALNASLLVSTYHAGKVVGVGVAKGELALSYHNLERAMGVAVRSEVMAVGHGHRGRLSRV